MTRPVYNEYHLSGQYLYLNDSCIKFDSEEQAREFLLEHIRKEVLR